MPVSRGKEKKNNTFYFRKAATITVSLWLSITLLWYAGYTVYKCFLEERIETRLYEQPIPLSAERPRSRAPMIETSSVETEYTTSKLLQCIIYWKTANTLYNLYFIVSEIRRAVRIANTRMETAVWITENVALSPSCISRPKSNHRHCPCTYFLLINISIYSVIKKEWSAE